MQTVLWSLKQVSVGVGCVSCVGDVYARMDMYTCEAHSLHTYIQRHVCTGRRPCILHAHVCGHECTRTRAHACISVHTMHACRVPEPMRMCDRVRVCRHTRVRVWIDVCALHYVRPSTKGHARLCGCTLTYTHACICVP